MPSLRRYRACGLPIAVTLGITLYAADAHAGPNDNSASRPWSLHFGLGPVVNLEGGHVWGRFNFDMEYHFKGGDVGPALGFYVPLQFDSNEVGMNLGPIFLWDFRLGRAGGAKFYLGPMVATGYGFIVNPADYDYHFWFIAFGPHFRILWRDKIGMYFRPLNFEVWAGPGVVTGNWSFVPGLAAAF